MIFTHNQNTRFVDFFSVPNRQHGPEIDNECNMSYHTSNELFCYDVAHVQCHSTELSNSVYFDSRTAVQRCVNEKILKSILFMCWMCLFDLNLVLILTPAYLARMQKHRWLDVPIIYIILPNNFLVDWLTSVFFHSFEIFFVRDQLPFHVMGLRI